MSTLIPGTRVAVVATPYPGTISNGDLGTVLETGVGEDDLYVKVAVDELDSWLFAEHEIAPVA